MAEDRVLGFDLNHYRKDVPLKQAKIQGGRFLIGKCSEGLTFVDETYEPYKLEAKNKNLPFGSFMYWRAIFDAVKQAKHYVDTMGETDFPPIVDVERYLNVKYGTNTPLLSVAKNRLHVRTVLNEVERLSGRRPMIYTNFASWRTIMADDPLILLYDVWVANYGRLVPYLPMPLKKWKIWQFTSSYKILNYYRGIDANWFNGNEADFENWLESMNQTPDPIDPIDPKEGFEAFFLNYQGKDYEGVVREVIKS